MPLRKKLKTGSQKTAHVGYVKRIYNMFALFYSFKFFLVFETHIGAVHQKLSYEGSFLRKNALTWFSSNTYIAYFLSAFFIGIFYLFIYLFIYLSIYLSIYLFIYSFYVYVDFKTFISIIF